MKSEILRLLKESDDYISGQQMCDRFHVSRTAVWKAIEQLKKEGYEIEAVRNRGYRLLESPDIMSEAEIRSLMDTEWAGKNIVYFDEIDSTNNRAKELGEKEGAHGTLFVADRQVAGKGRRGRVWESPKGISIYMTILLRPDLIPTKAPMLTLVMAQSVAEGIREVTGMETGIKWPNDIVMNKKKVCGILTEMSTEIDYINYVVIGTGINVNQTEFPEEIREIAGSLKQAAGHAIARAELVAVVMEELEDLYGTFLKTEDLSALKEEYNKHCVTCGHEIRVLEPGHEYTGVAEGINQDGELMVVRDDTGEKVSVYAGEVSVRGFYGYV